MSNEKTKDAVIVLSGGMDSVTLLYEQQARIALAITFDYGSNHNQREAMYAKQHCLKAITTTPT